MLFQGIPLQGVYADLSAEVPTRRQALSGFAEANHLIVGIRVAVTQGAPVFLLRAIELICNLRLIGGEVKLLREEHCSFLLACGGRRAKYW